MHFNTAHRHQGLQEKQCILLSACLRNIKAAHQMKWPLRDQCCLRILYSSPYLLCLPEKCFSLPQGITTTISFRSVPGYRLLSFLLPDIQRSRNHIHQCWAAKKVQWNSTELQTKAGTLLCPRNVGKSFSRQNGTRSLDSPVDETESPRESGNSKCFWPIFHSKRGHNRVRFACNVQQTRKV